jgi:nucleotide-binding universal stress UspA family protein
LTKLLALIDASIYAQSVCDHAAWAAERTGASVEIVHVLGRRDVSSAPGADYTGNLAADARDTLLAELASLDEQKAKLAQKRGRLILEQAKQSLEGKVGEVTTKLRHGDLLETVAEFQAGAEMIVIGKRGEAADFAKLHLGSNLERVARSTTKPVLVASRAFKPVRRALIAFDGGASALKAIDTLASGPLLTGTECLLLTVGSETAEARRRLDNAVAKLTAAGHSATGEIRPGQPEEVITRAVENDAIDLLVMGAFGHSRIRALFIGSTTVEMVRSCKIPVLLFR